MAEGQPLKNIRLSAGDQCVDGEALITRYGLEGGALYQLGRALRAMPGGPVLHIDLKPEVPEERLLARLSSAGGVAGATGAPDWECIARRLKLGVAARALLEFHGETVAASGGFDPPALAATVKGLRLPLTGPRPVAEAISSAGGVDWHELDDDLMLRRLPGVYLAGEMIDWEAPTGGYLLQGCFATGTRAGEAARRHALGSYGAVDPR
jgi:predicted flavoprotein YhiN